MKKILAQHISVAAKWGDINHRAKWKWPAYLVHVALFGFTLAAMGVGGCTAPGQSAKSASEEMPAERISLKLKRTIKLSGVGVAHTTAAGEVQGRFGHLAYDDENKRLFIAAPNEKCVVVVDLVSGKEVRRIAGLEEPDRIAIIPKMQSESSRTGVEVSTTIEARLAVSCRGNNVVHIYSLNDLTEREVVYLGGQPGAMSADYGDLVVAFGGEKGPGGLAFLDDLTLKIRDTMALPSKPGAFFRKQIPGKHSGGLELQYVYITLPHYARDGNPSAVVRIDTYFGRTHEIRLMDREIGDAAAYDGDSRIFAIDRHSSELICTDSCGETSRTPCNPNCDDVFYDAAIRSVVTIADRGVEVFKPDQRGIISKVAEIETAPNAGTGIVTNLAIYVACPEDNGQSARIMEFEIERS